MTCYKAIKAVKFDYGGVLSFNGGSEIGSFAPGPYSIKLYGFVNYRFVIMAKL